MCQIKTPDAYQVHESPTSSVNLLGSGRISETAEENLSARSPFSYTPGKGYWSRGFLRDTYLHGRKYSTIGNTWYFLCLSGHESRDISSTQMISSYYLPICAYLVIFLKLSSLKADFQFGSSDIGSPIKKSITFLSVVPLCLKTNVCLANLMINVLFIHMKEGIDEDEGKYQVLFIDGWDNRV